MIGGCAMRLGHSGCVGCGVCGRCIILLLNVSLFGSWLCWFELAVCGSVVVGCTRCADAHH